MLYLLLACSDVSGEPKNVPQDTPSSVSEKVVDAPVASDGAKSTTPTNNTPTVNTPTGLENERWKIVESAQKIEVVNKQNQEKRTIYQFVDEEGCDADGNAKPLSLVGDFFSWQESGSGYCEGAAHPYAYQEWYTVDLHESLQKNEYGSLNTMDITKIVSEDALLTALLQDKVVQKYWGTRAKPSTLSALLENIDGECDISFFDLRKDFSFHHIKKQADGSYNMAVRFGLPYGCEANRGNFTQLGIYFPIPTKYVADFVYADTHKQLGKYIAK